MVEQFCKSILRIVTRSSKSLANLVMGLASQTFARSVVEISLGNCYHYQHSSINKTISRLDKKLETEKQGGESEKLSRLEVEKKFANKGSSFCKAF